MRGRPKGSTSGPHKDSWNTFLLTFEIGERRWLETTETRYANEMSRINAPKSRRPPELLDRKFKTELFTAVSAQKAGKIVLLILVERVK